MKKYFVMLAMLACIGTTSAQEQIVANDVKVAQGGQGILAIDMQLPADHDYVSYQLKVELPEGISLVADDYGNAAFSLPESQPAAVFKITDFPASNGILKVASSPSTVIAAHEGTLVTIPVQANESLEIGTRLTGRISGVVFTHANATAQNFSDATFSIEVVENVTVLDETSGTLPEAAENVKVKVLRTIKADEWSTICLPFAMTETQVKAAFGDDVRLGDFCDTESTYSAGDSVVGISISFDEATAIEANHPYIIRVSRPIAEFTVDGVDIDPAEDDAAVEVDNGLTGRKRVVYGGFYGTYHAQTELENFALFLKDNKFWYSVGLTKMKAFRAYFVLLDVLTEVEDSYASRNITMSFNEDTDGIRDHVRGTIGSNNYYYDLQGRRIEKPARGLYIRNGRKEAVR